MVVLALSSHFAVLLSFFNSSVRNHHLSFSLMSTRCSFFIVLILPCLIKLDVFVEYKLVKCICGIQFSFEFLSTYSSLLSPRVCVCAPHEHQLKRNLLEEEDSAFSNPSLLSPTCLEEEAGCQDSAYSNPSLLSPKSFVH